MATTTYGTQGTQKQDSTQRVYWAIAIAIVLALIVFFAVRTPRVADEPAISNSVNSNLGIERTTDTTTDMTTTTTRGATTLPESTVERRETIDGATSTPPPEEPR